MARIVNILKYYCNPPFFSSTEACGCADPTLTITCPSGTTITVENALFGRTVHGSVYCWYSGNVSTGNDVPESGCVSPNAGDKAIVAAACDGQQTCSGVPGSAFTTDPCAGTYKYLRVTYTCDTSTLDPIGFQLGKQKCRDRGVVRSRALSFRMCLKKRHSEITW